MTPAELLAGYVRAGIDVYLDGSDVLRVRIADRVSREDRDRLVDAAMPALKHRKMELIEYLRTERAAAVERLIASAGTTTTTSRRS